MPLADVAPASQKALDFLFAHAVAGFAPNNGDAIMLLQAASLFSTRDLVVPTRFAPRPMASIPRLKPEDWLLDFLCTHVSASGAVWQEVTGADLGSSCTRSTRTSRSARDLSTLERFG